MPFRASSTRRAIVRTATIAGLYTKNRQAAAVAVGQELEGEQAEEQQEAEGEGEVMLVVLVVAVVVEVVVVAVVEVGVGDGAVVVAVAVGESQWAQERQVGQQPGRWNIDMGTHQVTHRNSQHQHEGQSGPATSGHMNTMSITWIAIVPPFWDAPFVPPRNT